MISKFGALVLPFATAMVLSACFSSAAVSTAETTKAMQAKTAVSSTETKTAVGTAKGTPITLTVGDTVITAVLDNSRTSQDFLGTLPLTMPMTRWGDREYYGKVQSALSTEGNQRSGFENGDVAYWPPGGSFAIFFDKANPTTPAPLVIMGKITSDLKVFDDLGESVEMKIEVKK